MKKLINPHSLIRILKPAIPALLVLAFARVAHADIDMSKYIPGYHHTINTGNNDGNGNCGNYGMDNTGCNQNSDGSANGAANNVGIQNSGNNRTGNSVADNAGAGNGGDNGGTTDNCAPSFQCQPYAQQGGAFNGIGVGNQGTNYSSSSVANNVGWYNTGNNGTPYNDCHSWYDYYSGETYWNCEYYSPGGYINNGGFNNSGTNGTNNSANNLGVGQSGDNGGPSGNCQRDYYSYNNTYNCVDSSPKYPGYQSGNNFGNSGISGSPADPNWVVYQDLLLTLGYATTPVTDLESASYTDLCGSPSADVVTCAQGLAQSICGNNDYITCALDRVPTETGIEQYIVGTIIPDSSTDLAVLADIGVYGALDIATQILEIPGALLNQGIGPAVTQTENFFTWLENEYLPNDLYPGVGQLYSQAIGFLQSTWYFLTGSSLPGLLTPPFPQYPVPNACGLAGGSSLPGCGAPNGTALAGPLQ